MSEVDDNLNYMLGQLSLVVSEFNQVLLILVKKKQNRLKPQLRSKLVWEKLWKELVKSFLKSIKNKEMEKNKFLSI